MFAEGRGERGKERERERGREKGNEGKDREGTQYVCTFTFNSYCFA